MISFEKVIQMKSYIRFLKDDSPPNPIHTHTVICPQVLFLLHFHLSIYLSIYLERDILQSWPFIFFLETGYKFPSSILRNDIIVDVLYDIREFLIGDIFE